MRRLIATGLLLCMVLLVPASAQSIRVCFIETEVLLPGWTASEASRSEKPKCCPECDGKEDGSCCLEVKKLPDAPAPSAPLELPPLLFCDLSREAVLPPCPVVELNEPFRPTEPIRGPDPPGTLRARLGVWNI